MLFGNWYPLVAAGDSVDHSFGTAAVWGNKACVVFFARDL